MFKRSAGWNTEKQGLYLDKTHGEKESRILVAGHFDHCWLDCTDR